MRRRKTLLVIRDQSLRRGLWIQRSRDDESPVKPSSPKRDARFGNAKPQKAVLLSEDPHQQARVDTRESINAQIQIFGRGCNSVGAIGDSGNGATYDRRARPVRVLSSER